MIDVENEIFTTVATDLRAKYSTIFVTGEIINAPSSFPAVSIIQTDSILYEKTFDTSYEEKFTQITYDINIYTNLVTGKKSQARQIAGVVDDSMRKLGFTRVMMSPIANSDTSIYRMTGRYTGVISADNIMYRR